jgi:hypothetical protein
MFNYRNQRLDITELEIDFFFITNIQGSYVEPCMLSLFSECATTLYEPQMVGWVGSIFSQTKLNRFK